MIKLSVNKYPVHHPLLKPLIKYFWAMESDEDVVIHHKLLPVSNIDIVLNFSAPMTYIAADEREITARGMHFNGIRHRYSMIKQRGRLRVIGISFFPTGLYPFLKIPLSEFTDQTVKLEHLNAAFTIRVEEQFYRAHSLIEQLALLEHELVQFLDMKLLPSPTIERIFHYVSSHSETLNIQRFCEMSGVHPRTLAHVSHVYRHSPETLSAAHSFSKHSESSAQQEIP